MDGAWAKRKSIKCWRGSIPYSFIMHRCWAVGPWWSFCALLRTVLVVERLPNQRCSVVISVLVVDICDFSFVPGIKAVHLPLKSKSETEIFIDFVNAETKVCDLLRLETSQIHSDDNFFFFLKYAFIPHNLTRLKVDLGIFMADVTVYVMEYGYDLSLMRYFIQFI